MLLFDGLSFNELIERFRCGTLTSHHISLDLALQVSYNTQRFYKKCYITGLGDSDMPTSRKKSSNSLSRGGIGIVIGAFIMLILFLLAMMMFVQIINRQQEIGMEMSTPNIGAQKAYVAALLSAGLCACTSSTINVKGLQGSFVNIIYKENVKLPNEVLLAVTIALNTTFKEGAHTLSQVILTPSSPQSSVTLIDPKTGQSSVALLKLLLPLNASSPTFELLYEGAKKNDWKSW